MTSAVTPRPRVDRRRPRRAFTLLETILALTLVVVIAGVVVVNLFGWGESRWLDEGSSRFATLLCMARAEAANMGKSLRIAFEPDLAGRVGVQVLLEADPLNAPRQFTVYDGCTWLHHVPEGLVEGASSRLVGESAYRWTDLPGQDEAADAAPMEPVTFYPDGSCDSAVIELVSTRASDSRLAIVEVEGLTGAVTRRMVSGSETEGYARQ